MIYALVHYPDIDIRHINQFRKKYDPQVDLIAPHITLMFPVPESVGEDNLIYHLESVLRNWQPFLIRLQEIQVASGDYLYLLLQEGNGAVIRLHDEIYTGMLVDFLRKDIRFVPHLTLGVYNDNLDHDDILEEAKKLRIDHKCILDKLHLIKVNDDRSRVVWSKEFSLTE